MAMACKDCDVKHVIWSTMENTDEVLKDHANEVKGDYFKFYIFLIYIKL